MVYEIKFVVVSSEKTSKVEITRKTEKPINERDGIKQTIRPSLFTESGVS